MDSAFGETPRRHESTGGIATERVSRHQVTTDRSEALRKAIAVVTIASDPDDEVAGWPETSNFIDSLLSEEARGDPFGNSSNLCVGLVNLAIELSFMAADRMQVSVNDLLTALSMTADVHDQTT